MCYNGLQGSETVYSLVHGVTSQKIAVSVVADDKTLNLICYKDLGDWLRGGQLRGQSSSPGGGKNCQFHMPYRPALGSTQSPI
jgi:hypothetical protein